MTTDPSSRQWQDSDIDNDPRLVRAAYEMRVTTLVYCLYVLILFTVMYSANANNGFATNTFLGLPAYLGYMVIISILGGPLVALIANKIIKNDPLDAISDPKEK